MDTVLEGDVENNQKKKKKILYSLQRVSDKPKKRKKEQNTAHPYVRGFFSSLPGSFGPRLTQKGNERKEKEN